MKTYPVLDVTSTTTPQQVFDAVCKHLKDQGGPSMNVSTCLNRTLEGRACAAACLLTDAESYGMVSYAAALYAQRPVRLQPFDELIIALQHSHDTAAFSWLSETYGIYARLKETAVRFGLEFNWDTL